MFKTVAGKLEAAHNMDSAFFATDGATKQLSVVDGASTGYLGPGAENVGRFLNRINRNEKTFYFENFSALSSFSS